MTGVFVFAARSSDAARAFAYVHVPRFAADESFICFDMAGEFLKRSVMKGEANPVHHVPCRLLGDSEVAGNFVAADTVLAGNEQPHGGEPLLKSDGAVLKNGASLQGESRDFRVCRSISRRVALPTK